MDRDFGLCLPLIPGLTLDLIGADGSIVKTFIIDGLINQSVKIVVSNFMLYLVLKLE